MNSNLFNAFSAALLLALAATCAAQQVTTAPAPTPWAITSRTGNSRIWNETTYELSPSGQVIPHIHSYTELATGLCYQQPGGDGQWMDSQETIDVLPSGSSFGASATNGQHQVYFPVDIYDGPIKLTTPDGLQIQAQPTCLCYDDGTNVALLGSITNSTGSLVANNVVIYQNAFTGIDADLRYTYRKSGFEQEVVVNKQLPPPEAFGLSSASANLEMVTEFAAPEPTQSASITGPNGLSDVMLSFDSMKMVRGKAFSIGGPSSTNSLPGGITVYKSWQHVGSEQLLLEALPFEQIAPSLSRLPALSSAIKMRARPVKRALMARILPPRHSRQPAAHQKRMAAASWHYRSGVVVDYQLVNGSVTNYTFFGDTTYYISSYMALYGTNNTLEGGSVLKFAAGCYGLVVEGAASGPSVKTLTGEALPVIFTAVDDNSVGTAITNSSGIPHGYYANYGLQLGGIEGSWDILKNLRISYAETGIEVSQQTAQLYDVQLMNCEVGCAAVGGAAVTIENALFGNDQTEFSLNSSEAWVTNATFSVGSSLATEYASDLYVANSILANITNSAIYVSGDHNGFYNSTNFGSDYVSTNFYPFQIIGGGGYYLTNGCSFRGAGTPNIDPALATDLAQRTTWAPVVYSNRVFSIATNFSPQAARENTNAPDLGYAYGPLDYVFGGCDLYSNLTFTAGTAVGWFEAYGGVNSSSQPYGISLNGGANLAFNGNATEPCIFARYPMVQEGESGNWTNSGWMGGIMLTVGSPVPQLSADFAKFTSDNWNGNLFRDYIPSFLADNAQGGFQNCEFYDFGISTYWMASLTFTNCLFFRFNQSFWDPPNLTFANCTLYNGGLYLGSSSHITRSIENCAFDGTAFYWTETNYAIINYNAYNTNNLSWASYPYYNPTNYGTNVVVGPDDKMVSNFEWESSFFGSFYQPPSSPTFQAGSPTANLLGLYWFTTQTNQTINGTNQVTIGYQYVATDTNGNPFGMCGTPYYVLYPNGPPALSITMQPFSQTNFQGSNMTFTVTATGAPPLSYQWYWNGTNLSDAGGIYGSASATLSINGLQLDQAGTYQVVVSDAFGSVTSSLAALSVLPLNTNYLFPQYVMSPSAYWNVTDISDPAQPVHIGELQAPFGGTNYNNGDFGDLPLPNTLWHTNSVITITNAYGTTELGGISNMGTVFEIGLTGGVATLCTFTNLNGAYPCSQLAISGSTYYGISNKLFGTTLGGGSNGFGTVFRLNADSTGFTNLYDFTGWGDGKFPRNGLLIDGNILYGTTSNSIFKINTDGSDFTCLTTNVTNASQLILSLSGGTLYGMTTNEGSYGGLFSIGTAGTSLTWLRVFTGATNDGAFPMGGLEILECSNTFIGGLTATDVLFGTTYGGGMSNLGMVFSINTDGSGFNDLHDFTGTNDGANPAGGLLLTNNNILWANILGPIGSNYLYGTTASGGRFTNGTVFGMNLDGSGFTNFYSFRGTDGAKPAGRLALAGRTLYGTTSGGGTNGYGTIFSINNDGSDFADLYSFHGGTNGISPVAGLALPVVDNLWSIWSLDTTVTLPDMACKYQIAIDDSFALFVNGNLVNETNSDGVAFWLPLSSLPYVHPGQNEIRVIIAANADANDYFAMQIQGFLALPRVLFGTTTGGGSSGDGTVFEMGYSNDDVVLHNFSDVPDGKTPIGDLVLFSNTLYGVTQYGGSNSIGATGNGTIFRISPDGTYANLYSFSNAPDGENPVAGLILSNNVLYGTTEFGGANDVTRFGTHIGGTIFKINTDGTEYQVLHSFAGTLGGGNDGANPLGQLLLVGTNLYGTTHDDGAGAGNIFSIATNGSAYTVVFNFGGSAGNNPAAGLILSGTNLYGTTQGGGNNASGGNQGTIFSFAFGGTTDVVLHTFSDTPDGNGPVAGLVLSGNTLYGTTPYGGSNSDGTMNYGTIFSIGTGGSGYTTLLSFGSTNSNFGVNPFSDLLVLSNSLYGTTYGSGISGRYGLVFSVGTNGAGFDDIFDFSNSPDGANPKGGVSSP